MLEMVISMLRDIKDDLVIDGVQMAPYLLEATFGYHKIWSKNSGRNSLTGDNSGRLIGIYPKITMKFRRLNTSEVGLILRLFNKANNVVKCYNPDLNKIVTMNSCYSNDQEINQKYLGKIDGYSAAVISNKKRESYI